MHKLLIYLICIFICSCTKTNIDKVTQHRQKILYKSEMRFPEKTTAKKEAPSYKNNKIHTLIPHQKLDTDLNFKVSQRFKRSESESWNVPELDSEKEGSIFSLRPKKTDSTIKIQLKKRN
jgi:hypothetical protein